MAAVKNYHTVSGLEQQICVVSQPESEISMTGPILSEPMLLPETTGKNPLVAFFFFFLSLT